MDYQLELRQMRYFLAVAEDLHFRKAAERLFISQPGLSKQIKELEISLGLKLFDRHNRKVELTKAGLHLKNEFQSSFQNLNDAIRHAKSIQDGAKGELKFGYVGSAMEQIIPDLLTAFRKMHPKILFSFKEMDNQQQIDQLLSNEIDIGFVRINKVPPGIIMHSVLEEAFCLVLPKKHPINEKNFSSMDQLQDDSFILFDAKYSSSYFAKVMQIFDDAGFIPNIGHNTIHSSSIFKLVENNFGISIIPKSLKIKHSKNIKFIDLDRLPQRTILSAVWRSKFRNPALVDFIEEVKRK